MTLNIIGIVHRGTVDFQQLEVVDRGSETQPQGVGNLKN